MMNHLEIERADAKEIVLTQIDPPHGCPFYELSITTYGPASGSSIVVYLTKEDRETLLKALMEPKK